LLCCVSVVGSPNHGIIRIDVYHRGVDVGMPQQLLDLLDFHSPLGQVRGEGPPEPMRMDAINARTLSQLFQDSLDQCRTDPATVAVTKSISLSFFLPRRYEIKCFAATCVA